MNQIDVHAAMLVSRQRQAELRREARAHGEAKLHRDTTLHHEARPRRLWAAILRRRGRPISPSRRPAPGAHPRVVRTTEGA